MTRNQCSAVNSNNEDVQDCLSEPEHNPTEKNSPTHTGDDKNSKLNQPNETTSTYYPVVPAVVGTTSNSDMTGFEASGGCRGKGG